MTLSIYLFGPPRLEKNGQPVTVARRKALALLAYLAATERPCSRDELATMFWPESDQTRALANLRRALWELTDTLGTAYFSIDRSQVSVSPEAGCRVDVHAFRHRIARVKSHQHAGECDECRTALAEAVTYYSGDFMSGFTLPDCPAFDEWQFFEGQELRGALAEGLQQLIEWHVAEGAFDEALPYGRRRLALDPLHEPAQRKMMQLYAQAGQRSAALRQYDEYAQLLAHELGVEPEPEISELYAAIRQRAFPPLSGEGRAEGVPASRSAPVQHNLPAQRLPIIGRSEELAEMVRQIAEDENCRLLTLVGPGGVGKTRLAEEAGLKIAGMTPPPFADGIRYVELAALDDAETLPLFMANALRLTAIGDERPSRQHLLESLRWKQLLILLDNIEHLLDENTTLLVSDILTAAAGVKLLVTSRTRLNVRGEHILPLVGLEVPEDRHGGEAISRMSSIQMFAQRAGQVQRGFRLDMTSLPEVVRICRLVQGMPLGIELAAAWLAMLDVSEIAAEIERSLDFLAVPYRDLPLRQRSLRAVFEGSWQQLNARERDVVRNLTVFQGGFSLDAGRAVADADLHVLLALTNKSWLRRTAAGRFSFHELLRQYAAEQMQEDVVALQSARQRHAEFYAEFLARQDEAMKGPEQKQAFQAIDDEFNNIRVAWRRLMRERKPETIVLQMLPAMFRFCEARARATEFLTLVEPIRDLVEALDNRALGTILTAARAAFYRYGYSVRHDATGYVHPEIDPELDHAWRSRGTAAKLSQMRFWGVMLAYLYGRLRRLDQGLTALEQLAGTFHEQRERWLHALTLTLWANLRMLRHEEHAQGEENRRLLEQALAIFNELGDRQEGAYALRSLGQSYRLQREFARANVVWEEAQARLAAMGEWAIAADISWQLGDSYLQLGEIEQGLRCYRDCWTVYAEKGNWELANKALSKQSYETLRYGDLDEALRLREQSLEFARRAGDPYGLSWGQWELGEIYRVAGDLYAARQSYEVAFRRFRDADERAGFAFYYRSMAEMALAIGDLAEAQRAFTLSLEEAQAVDHQWATSYAMAGLGRTAALSSRTEVARDYLVDSLQLAQIAGDAGLALVVLAATVSYFVAAGRIDQALELGRLILGQPTSWRETREQVATLLSLRLNADLSAITESGPAPSNAAVWETIATIVKEL